MTRQILLEFSSRSNGRAQGRVFPDPIPAITVASSPRASASATSSCQSDGLISGQTAATASEKVLRASSESYPTFLARALARTLYESSRGLSEVCHLKIEVKIEYLIDLNRDRAPFSCFENEPPPPPSFQIGGTPPSSIQFHQTVYSPILDS